MYKLIAIDLDGTLLNYRHEITEKVKQAINEVKKRGIKIVLCSGRPIGGIEQYIEVLNLNEEDDYVIAYNGALVQNTRTKQPIVDLSLRLEDLKKLYEISIQLQTPMHFFDIEAIYTSNENINRFTVFESYVNDIPLRYRRIDELQTDILLPKIMFINQPEKLQQTIKELPNELYEQYTIVQSAPYFLEFVHPKASKGNAVKYLAQTLGINQNEVMTIGDNGNDLSMIEYAGCGVAMGNAIPTVKNIADFETLTNNEDGVAHALNKLILDR